MWRVIRQTANHMMHDQPACFFETCLVFYEDVVSNLARVDILHKFLQTTEPGLQNGAKQTTTELLHLDFPKNYIAVYRYFDFDEAGVLVTFQKCTHIL